MIAISIESPNHTRYEGTYHDIDLVENQILLNNVICYGKKQRPLSVHMTDISKRNYCIPFPLEYVQHTAFIVTKKNRKFQAQFNKIDPYSKLPKFQHIKEYCKECDYYKQQFHSQREAKSLEVSKFMKNSIHNSINLKINNEKQECITNYQRQMNRLRIYTDLIGNKPKLKIK